MMGASEKLIDLWQCAITEASVALGPDCVLDDGVERLDYPKKIPLRGRYAYLRKEPYFKEASAKLASEAGFDDFDLVLTSCAPVYSLGHRRFARNSSLGRKRQFRSEWTFIIPLK
jgi:hypothetical protein